MALLESYQSCGCKVITLKTYKMNNITLQARCIRKYIIILMSLYDCSYLIENDVCYLVLCERNFSKRTAYSYLEDIAQEFHTQYGKRVNSVARPYQFIEFGRFIQKHQIIIICHSM